MMHTKHPHESLCEHHEVDLSAVIDGELGSVDLLETLDHLVECPKCADFYRRGRRLGLAVAESCRPQEETGDQAFGIDPHESVWRRIAERSPWSQDEIGTVGLREMTTGSARAGRASGRREWMARLAAVVVIGFGVWLLQPVWRGSGPPGMGDGDASISSSAGAQVEMSEERFTALAIEVLHADPKYHHEMLEVMKSATRADAREATVDYRRSNEGLDFAGGTGGDRDLTTDGRVWQ